MAFAGNSDPGLKEGQRMKCWLRRLLGNGLDVEEGTGRSRGKLVAETGVSKVLPVLDLEGGSGALGVNWRQTTKHGKGLRRIEGRHVRSGGLGGGATCPTTKS